VEVTAASDHLSRWVDVKDGSSAPSSIEISPRVFAPNVTAIIHFGLPINGVVSLRIYDGTGTLAANLVNHIDLVAGSYAVQWDASSAGSGVYVFMLIYQGLSQDLQPNTPIFRDTKKLLLLK